MTPRRVHGMEKLQVQLGSVAALAVTYFLFWKVVEPTDPEGAVALVATGEYGRLAMLAALLWVLAALSACATPSARPEAAMLVVLIGAGGVSLRSASIRTALWLRQGDLGAVYWQMIAELAALAAAAVVAAGVLRVIRGAAGRLLGKWRWQDPFGSLSDDERREWIRAEMDGEEAKGEEGGRIFGGGFTRLLVEDLGVSEARRAGRRVPGGDVLTRCVLCFLLALMTTVGLVWLLARSADRGQVLFALLAGCFLAALIAYQVFPTRFSFPAWAAPLATAGGFYVLAAVGAGSGPGAWMHVQNCYRALPIDWIAAGLGGGLLGYCVSLRMHESRFFERQEEKQEGA
jgi:hypothetical protein